MTRASHRFSIRCFNFESREVARGMTDVDVGSGALFGEVSRGRRREMILGSTIEDGMLIGFGNATYCEPCDERTPEFRSVHRRR